MARDLRGLAVQPAGHAPAASLRGGQPFSLSTKGSSPLSVREPALLPSQNSLSQGLNPSVQDVASGATEYKFEHEKNGKEELSIAWRAWGECEDPQGLEGECGCCVHPTAKLCTALTKLAGHHEKATLHALLGEPGRCRGLHPGLELRQT